jgi:hypothetical protein
MIDLKATDQQGGFGRLLSPAPRGFIAAAAGAAALVLLGLAIFWQSAGSNDRTAALDARLTQIEQQVRGLADRPLPPAVDPKVVDGLAGRVAALEAAAREPRPPAVDPALSDRVSTLESQLKALDEKVAVATRRSDDVDSVARNAQQRGESAAAALDQLRQKVAQLPAQTAASAEIEALANRIATLERNLTGVKAELGKDLSVESADHAARTSVAAAALDAAAERGEPFAGEFAALQALGADPKVLAAVEPFAASGIPSAASLCGELLTLIPALNKNEGATARDGGVFARLAAGAESLVRIRPIGDVRGDDPTAILARVELRAEKSDVAGALSELAKLPEEAQAPAQAWIAKARARAAALAASRQLASESFAALAKPAEAR